MLYRTDKEVRMVWTLDLNGFFYNHIFVHNSEGLTSNTFSRYQDSHEYLLIICPRSRDKWRMRHCSLFVYLLGQDLQVPKRVVVHCRIPGVSPDFTDGTNAVQYFELTSKDFDIVPYGEGYIIAHLFNFLSYSFFVKNLNVVPFFQIVTEFVF